MTRVTNAAALTLQTWSRSVLAKKDVSHQREQRMKQKSLLDSTVSDNISVEVVARRFLLVAACITLLGLTTQTAVAGGSPQVVLASSPSLEEAPSRLFSMIVGALPSLLRSSHRG